MNGATLVPVVASEREDFLAMAIQHFMELNPQFVPQDDWKQQYFENIVKNRDWRLRWIKLGNKCIGFALYGIESHRFLPRKTGMVYELYVVPPHRRRGVATVIARQILDELWLLTPSKIQLEVVDGNTAASELWKAMGFRKVTERLVLSRPAK